MSHTELYFMIQNYVLFASLGLLVICLLIEAVLLLLVRWRGGKK